jgi:hypothetical protein
MPAGRPKGSGGTNKSAAIREYLKNHPGASTNEVLDALGQKGIEVSQALIAGVRGREERGPGNKSRKGAITVDELTSIHTIIEKFDDRDIIMSIVSDLSNLIKEVGGIERFEEAMKAYSSWKPSEAMASEVSSSESISDSSDDDDDEIDDEDEDEDDDD